MRLEQKKKKIHFPYSSLKQCFPTVMCTQILEGSCGLCLVWPGLKESAFLTSCLVLVILLVPKLYFVGGPRRHLHFLSFTPFNLLFFFETDQKSYHILISSRAQESQRLPGKVSSCLKSGFWAKSLLWPLSSLQNL